MNGFKVVVIHDHQNPDIETVECIPEEWMVNDNQAFLPPKIESSKKLLIEKHPPKKHWKVFNVRILHSAETFEEADKLAEAGTYSSDIEINRSEPLGKGKRRIFQKTFPGDESDIDLPPQKMIKNKRDWRPRLDDPFKLRSANTSNKNMCPPPSQCAIPSISIGPQTFPPISPSLNAQPIPSSSFHSQPIPSSSFHSQPISSPIFNAEAMPQKTPIFHDLQPAPQSSYWHSQYEPTTPTIVDAINTLSSRFLAFEEEIMRKLVKMDQKIDSLAQSQEENRPISESFATELSLPLQTVEDFNAFDDRLKQQEGLFQHLTKKLTKQGGHSSKQRVKNVMNYLMVHELQVQFNLEGRKNGHNVTKQAFGKSEIYRAVIDAVMTSSKVTVDEARKDIMTFLRNAPDRQQGRLKRQEATTNLN